MSAPTVEVPLLYIPNAIPDADRLFQALLVNLPWTRQTYKFMGNTGPVPREEVWVSATGYRYGGRTYPGWDELGGCKWTPDLLAIKTVVVYSEADRDAKYAPTESEREQMLLHVLREHGLPEPERQFSIYDDSGTFVARPDLVYRDMKIAMEYDSYQYHVGNEAHVRDSRRRNAMIGIGWLPLVATAEDVRFGTGRQFVRDVKRARATRKPASSEVV